MGSFNPNRACCYICRRTVRREDTEVVRRGNDLALTICKDCLAPIQLDAYENSMVPLDHE